MDDQRLMGEGAAAGVTEDEVPAVSDELGDWRELALLDVDALSPRDDVTVPAEDAVERRWESEEREGAGVGEEEDSVSLLVPADTITSIDCAFFGPPPLS